ncbi:MAG TPA: NFACT family protein [Coleofasciculaceae cyanobacterium]|jgi:predicted ribosome quality control (RQC) complex YloA/Tae2 family protein
MQQLDAITLKALAAEAQSLLDNAKVSKVQHPSAHEFLITFWGGPPRRTAQGENRDLFYIHLNPEMPFCVLTDTRHRQETALHTFSKPTALCMLLRKHLSGANLVAVRTLPAERVLDLVFENFNELGNRVRLVLSMELMGKHSNMILYDEVQGLILAVAHGVSEQMSSHRELAPGLPYAPPPRPAGKRMLSELTTEDFLTLWDQKPDEESAIAWLNRYLAGFGQRMLEDALNTQAEPRKIYHTLVALENDEHLRPAMNILQDRFTLAVPEADSGWKAYASVNALVSDYFLGHLREVRMQRKRQQLTQLLAQQEKKLQRREKELVPVGENEIAALQNTGDRLLAGLSTGELPAAGPAHPGKVTLAHYETGEPWEIEIDSSCGWVENAQIYYRQAKKAKSRRDVWQQMSAQLNAERDYQRELRQMIAQAESMKELDALETELAVAGFGRQKDSGEASGKKREAEITGVMNLRSSDGLEILVGKSGQGNEAIVGKLSRPEDLWLHVHQMPGSHVLVRCGRGEAVPDQTLLEAATLAVYYSSARESLNVPVTYTQAKFVRKIPGSYPGHVNYRQEQTVFITPDPVLVESLMQARPAKGGEVTATS